MGIKTLLADIRNTHDYENLEYRLGDELGNKIYKLLKLCDGLPNNEEQALTIPDVSNLLPKYCPQCGEPIKRKHKIYCPLNPNGNNC
jgi:hypothetical protein